MPSSQKHNEYNNNEEDYQKFKKDKVIKSIFKKLKDKLESVDIYKDGDLSHVNPKNPDDTIYLVPPTGSNFLSVFKSREPSY